MIEPSDRVSVPRDVVVADGMLRDLVRGTNVQLNATGAASLGAQTPAAMGARIAQRYSVGEERAAHDALVFCFELNARALLNVDVRFARLAWRWLNGAFALQRAPLWPQRRTPLETSSTRAAIATAACAVLTPSIGVAIATAAVTAAVLAIAASVDPLLIATIGAAAGGGLFVHELGHVALLRGVPACVVSRFLRVRVLHRAVSTRRAAVVAAAGPGAGIVLAAVVLVALSVSRSPALAPATLLLAAQAVGLTIATHDGRTICGIC